MKEFAKLVDGNLTIAPNPIWADGKMIANPTSAILKGYGWKELIRKDQPEYQEGYYFKPVYTEEWDTIIMDWEKVEIEQTELS